MDSGSETHELNGTAEGAESAAEEQRRRRPWFQRNRPININHYANKKSAAESMLDIALLMANASQLKAVMEQGPSFSFYVPLIVLISLSLTLQVMVGVLLIFLENNVTGELQKGSERQNVHRHVGVACCLYLGCVANCIYHCPPGVNDTATVRYDLNNPEKHGKLNFLNNLATGLVFIIVVVNIFITAFGVQKPVAEPASRQ